MLVPRKNAFVSLSQLEQVADGSAVNRARSIAHLLDRDHYPIPFVFPTDERGIQFEWKGGARELNLEIPSAGEPLTFLTIVDGNPALEGTIASHNVGTEVRRLVDWMLFR